MPIERAPTLLASLDRGVMHHAYLLVGCDYAFLKACVREALLALGMKVNKEFSNHPDAIVLGASAGEEGAGEGRISIDDVRTLKARSALNASFKDGWRVGVIEGVERMTPEAAAAFLKLLEEPGSRSVFFLFAKSADEVMPTLRSRCHVAYVDAPYAAGTLLEAHKELAAAGERFLKGTDEEKWQVLELLFGKKESDTGAAAEHIVAVWQVVTRGCWRAAGGRLHSKEKVPDAWRAIGKAAGEPSLRRVLNRLLQMPRLLAHNVNPRLLFEDLLINYTF